MTRRWMWGAGAALLVALAAVAGWILARELPGRIRQAGEMLRAEASRYGLAVSFRDIRFEFFALQAVLDDVEIRDAATGRRLAAMGSAEASLSPGRLLTGRLPVSRIRVRRYAVRAGEEDLALVERFRSGRGGGAEDPFPEIVLLDGRVELGPFGPVGRFRAHLPEVRIHESRFFGTRVSAEVRDASGDLVLAAPGPARWPFDEADADILVKDGRIRIRKLSLRGPPGFLKAAGVVTPEGRTADLDLSGKIDVAGWVASGAPGGDRMARLVRGGKIDFSASVRGTPDDPSGSATVVLKEGRFGGETVADGSLAMTFSGRKIRLESLRGRLWGGELSGGGHFDLATRRGEGTLTLTRAALGDAPWKDWGAPWRPSGSATLAISVSGSPERMTATLAADFPGGVEAVPGGASGGALRLPVAASIAAEIEPWRRVTVSAFRIRAGSGELTGQGTITLPGGAIDMAGGFALSPGRMADYGWNYPVAWRNLDGRWALSGTAARPKVAAGLTVQGLAMRALPPVPAAIKIEGDLAEAVHFVADVPAEVASVTATGTIGRPLLRGAARLEASVAVRDVDFSMAGTWIPAMLSSLGEDPGETARQVAGLSGTGNADLVLGLAPGTFSLSGTAEITDLSRGDIAARDIRASGSFRRTGAGTSWEGEAGGHVAGGRVALRMKGRDGGAEVSCSGEGVDLEVLAALAGAGRRGIPAGKADFSADALRVSGRWDIRSARAVVPRLSVGGFVLEGIVAEGSLVGSSGRLTTGATAPAVTVQADVRREEGWPVSFRASVDNVPVGALLAAAGRKDVPSEGTWSGSARGHLRLSELLGRRASASGGIVDLKIEVSADGPRIAGAGFRELRIEGSRRGEAIAGTLRTKSPDTDLSFTVALREPFSFVIAGPLAAGSRAEAPVPNVGPTVRRGGLEEFQVSGSVEIAGALRALDRTRGSVRVHRLAARLNGIDLAAEDAFLELVPEGIRWASGSVRAAGNPLRVSGRVSWEGSLDLRFAGTLPAGTLRLVTDVFDRLDGSVKLDVRATGDWRNPSVVGTGRLEGGVFSFRGYDQIFEGMSGEAVISQNKIVFEHFQGRSGGGFLDGRGELPLVFSKGDRLFFSVDFFDLHYPYPSDFRPVLQGHIELTGPISDLLVTGDVEVQSAHYTRNLKIETAFTEFRRRLADVRARQEKREFLVRFDVNVVADSTIRIENNMFEGDAKGEFKVVGDMNNIIVLGAFDVPEGQVTYGGNRFDIDLLSVEFQDPRRNNPRLDGRAEGRVKDFNVTVTLQGTLDKPELDLASDPPLSKNEIVALLALGVTPGTPGSDLAPPGTVTAGEAAAIAYAPFQGPVEEKLVGITGLNRFSIEPAFSTVTQKIEPRFIVGKSFGDRFSVNVSTTVGTTSETNVTAEYEFYKDMFLQGGWESTSDSSQGDVGADVKVRFRYRQFKDIFRGGE